MYIDKNNTVDGRTPAQVEVGSLSRYFFRSAEKKPSGHGVFGAGCRALLRLFL